MAKSAMLACQNIRTRVSSASATLEFHAIRVQRRHQHSVRRPCFLMLQAGEEVLVESGRILGDGSGLEGTRRGVSMLTCCTWPSLSCMDEHNKYPLTSFRPLRRTTTTALNLTSIHAHRPPFKLLRCLLGSLLLGPLASCHSLRPYFL